MMLGEGAPGGTHLSPAFGIRQQGIDLAHQIVGVTDCQRRTAGGCLAHRFGKIPR